MTEQYFFEQYKQLKVLTLKAFLLEKAMENIDLIEDKEEAAKVAMDLLKQAEEVSLDLTVLNINMGNYK